MGSAIEEQMGCLLRHPPPWVVVVAIPTLVFAGYWGFGFLSIFLTSSALVLSTVLITSSKNNPQEGKQLLAQSPDRFDGSISDEESLFEIDLPCGCGGGHNKDDCNLQLESIFQQHSLIMELLDEEDNMIEIDLSMGSIKVSD